MCYAKNCLPHLLWNGCPQILYCCLYCFLQRAGRNNLQKQAIFHLYRRFASLCQMARRKQLQRCVYGIYREVLDSCLQHLGNHLPSTTRIFFTAKQSSRFADAIAFTLPSPGVKLLILTSIFMNFLRSASGCGYADNDHDYND